MSATTCNRFSRVSGASGLMISLAVVFAGNAAFAEGVTEFRGVSRLSAGMLGEISATDLEKLEHASSAQVTAARLAAMGVKTLPTKASSRTAVETAFAAPADDTDLFPHSSRVLPMLVTRPAAETYVGRAAIAPRPGLAQPVGVSRSSLRPRTPSERAAR